MSTTVHHIRPCADIKSVFCSSFRSLGRTFSQLVADTYNDELSPVQPLLKYWDTDDPLIREWSAAHEELWGLDLTDCVTKSRQQQTPNTSLQQPQPQSNLLRLTPNRRSPDQQAELARPLQELRPSSRTTHEFCVDSSSQQRVAPQNQAAGRPSLPSLKSSGLLDSWGSGK